ncbi:MAG: bile acid:sodium symporter family protein [Candidatus Latescibacter sp.]|nr:bile acid:sodium symporter family protein [Candidatus Latescibacter sp.]
MAGHKDKSPLGIKGIYPFFLILSLVCLMITTVLLSLGYRAEVGPFAVMTFVSLALYVRGSEFWSVTAFTLWVTAFVTTAMFFPRFFTNVHGVETKPYIMNIIQFIMFGMGTTLSIRDFKRVFIMPQTIVIGIVLQYTVMPFVGKGIAMLFAPNPEVAAGIVLNGSCPGGVASNVINFLAKANVALSVTLTAVSTLVAPVMTPTMTKWLAGAYIPINFFDMMWSIFQMIIFPVGGGLLVNTFLRRMSKVNPKFALVSDGIMRSLPFFSMFGICVANGILTAYSRDSLLVGAIVFSILISIMLHNFMGYMLGYWCSRALGIGIIDSRTIAVEVGLQNSAMAAGLAIKVLHSNLAALPGVVFASWQNMSGAILASYWARRPVVSEAPAPVIEEAEETA